MKAVLEIYSPSVSADYSVSGAEAFKRACRFEVRHLTGLRSTWILIAIIFALCLLSGAGSFVGLDKERGHTARDLEFTMTWSPVLAQICSIGFYLMVLGTGPVSAELVRGSARTTWLTVGGRSIAYWSKCAVGVTVGVGVALAGALVEAVSSAVVFAVVGAPQPRWVDLVFPMGRLLLWVACWMLLCTAVSALIRNRVGPILVLCLMPLIGERILGGLLGRIPGIDLSGLGDWLPFATGRAMVVDLSSLSEADRGLLKIFLGSDISTLPAGVAFCSYTTVLVLAGWAVYRRRSG